MPTPTSPSSSRGKAGRNHLNEEIIPLLPTGIGERFSRTISNLGHGALLRRCELPPINESAELTRVDRGPLVVNSVLLRFAPTIPYLGKWQLEKIHLYPLYVHWYRYPEQRVP